MLSYSRIFEIVQTTVAVLGHSRFFNEGCERRAALAGIKAQSNGGSRVVVINAIVKSLENDSRVCRFDDPCDTWKIAA